MGVGVGTVDVGGSASNRSGALSGAALLGPGPPAQAASTTTSPAQTTDDRIRLAIRDIPPPGKHTGEGPRERRCADAPYPL
ncbi:hypothetical protein GCM10009610_40540 [Pseudonocardia xinjiangensis]